MKDAENPKGDENMQPPGKQPGQPPAQAPRRRRRWPYALGAVVLVLILLVALAPFWASTGPGSRMVFSLVNRNILGSMGAGQLSLSWGGPSVFHNVVVRDPDGREVLEVERVTWQGGVWRVVRSPMSFGDVEVESPRAALYIDEDLQLSLVKAFQTHDPAPPDEELPEVRGRVVVQGGQARVIPLVGEPFDVTDIEGHIRLDTLNDIEGGFRLAPPGGNVRVEAAITELLADGRRVDIFGASGSFHVATDDELDAAPLAEVLAPGAGVVGATRFESSGTFQAGEVSGDVNWAVRGLHTRQPEGTQVEPVDFTLAGQMAGNRAQVTGEMVLSGEPGEVQSQLTWNPGDEPQVPDLSPGRVLAAVLNGEALDLPDFILTGTGRVDLPALAQAVPALLNLREDVEVTEGTVVLEAFSFQGGAHPSAAGNLELTQVRARRQGQEVELQPAQVAFDAFVAPGEGIEVRQAALSSGFLAAEGAGTARELQVSFNGDLGRIEQEWGEVFELDPQHMAGIVEGTARLVRATDDRVDVVATIHGQGLHYASDSLRPEAADPQPQLAGEDTTPARVPQIRIQQASLQQEGHFIIEGRQVTRLVLAQGQIDLDGRLRSTASGLYNFTDGRFEWQAEVHDGDVEWLAARAEDLGLDALSGYGGRLTLTANVERSSMDAPFVTGGQLVMQQVTHEGQPLWPNGQVRVDWSDGRYDPAVEQSSLAQAQLRSPMGDLALSQLRYDHRLASMHGELRASADLAPSLEAADPLVDWERPPPVGGRLAYAGALTLADGVLSLNGDGTVRDFMVGSGERIVRQEELRLASDVRVDMGRESIAISRFDMTSDLLALNVAGSIDDYRATRNLALTCEYRSQWAPLVALLHGMVPATEEVIELSGTFSDRFEVRGPAHQPEVSPPFRGLQAETAIAWDTATVYGVQLDQATLPVRLADGRLEMPMTPIPAAEGTLHLGGVLDFAPEHPTLLLAGRQPILEEVRVDRRMSQELLSRMNPIFAGVTRIDGTASLVVEEVIMPLAGDLAGASGSGQLALGEMQVQPGGFFKLLLELGHVLEPGVEPSMYTTRFSDLNFRLADGRISYEDFQVIFAGEGFDLVFSGSVGLDDRLDLVVSVPVRPRLLERFGVRGPTLGYAEALADVRVPIPIGGTRQEPQLDFTRVDVRPLIAEATRALARDQARGLIGDLLGDPVGPRDPDDPEDPEEDPPRERPRDPLDVEERARDVLRGLVPRRDRE